jgi:hypothetical protein
LALRDKSDATLRMLAIVGAIVMGWDRALSSSREIAFPAIGLAVVPGGVDRGVDAVE